MEKINIAELLKDCPKGMELDCTMFEGVFLERIDKNVEYPIVIRVGKTDVKHLTKEGCWNKYSNAKCVIFPKGKTTWEGFVPPSKFNDGDIVYIVTDECDYRICIFERIVGNNMHTIASVTSSGHFFCPCKEQFDAENFVTYRLATEEEKQVLFDAIKDNGYKWNAETKTLEKLIEPRFDITTLVPFKSEVLVRNDESQYWIPAFWGCKRADGYTTTFGWCKYCIPFEGNEHLLGKNDDCDEFYKTWE